MNHKEAVNLMRTIETLAAALGVEEMNLRGWIALGYPEAFNILNEAVDKFNEFNNAPLIERGKMFGLNIIQHRDDCKCNTCQAMETSIKELENEE